MRTLVTILYTIGMVFGVVFSALGQAVVPGDIIITEFMADPSATADGEGEYVELYNKRSVAINIDGFILKDDGSNSHTIDNGGTLNIPAGGFIVLAVSGTPGFTPDYIYSSFTLANSSDEIVLTDAEGTEIARVNYTGSQVTTGVSAELNAIGDVDNNGQIDPNHFQDSITGIGNGDKGTPGSAGSTNLDEDPTVRFSTSGATVNEADGTIPIEVILEDPDGNAVDVDVVFQQAPSTAHASDFTTSTTQTVSFGSGAMDGDTLNASFTLDNDSDYEGTEIGEFTLTNIISTGAASIVGQNGYTLTIEDDETPDVVINEFLADPGGNDVDGNGNPSPSGSDDEFIEIFNFGTVSVDISGWGLSDNGSNVTHIFNEGTILHPSQAIIVFSNDSGESGPVGLFGGALVVISNDGVLSLNNTGDTPTLKDEEGNIIDSYNYTSSTSGVSLVRDPEGSGTFADHDGVAGASGNYSPGTKTNGDLFTTSLVIEGNAGWRMLSAPVASMPISEITDDTPIQGYGDGFNKNFYTGYDGSSFTAPSDLTGNLTPGKGFILYFYNNTQANSSTLPVVIDAGSGTEPENDVTVNVHADNDGWNLLGNPYQTAFDLNSISESDGSMASLVGQIWSDEAESYILTSANNDKVAPGQGFFLQNDTTSGGTPATSVTLPTSGKTTGSRFYKTKHQKAFLQLALIAQGANREGEQRDLSSILYFHEDATDGWDKWDAEKLYPLKSGFSLLNIVSDGNDKVKAQDSRAFENLGDEIFHLDVEAVNVSPQHRIEWNNSSNIPDEWVFTFVDNKTGEEIIMDETFSYQFTEDEISRTKNKIPSTLTKSLTVNKEYATPRFTIRLSKGETTSNEPDSKPDSFILEQNYPNPFNPATEIKYQVPANSKVSLMVYNVMGQRVAILVDDRKSAGVHRAIWNATNMASGVYYYRFKAGGQVITRQMTLIK